MTASALTSEFCTVQVLEGLKTCLSALRNSKVSAFGSILKLTSVSIGITSICHLSEEAAIGKCSGDSAVIIFYNRKIFDKPDHLVR